MYYKQTLYEKDSDFFQQSIVLASLIFVTHKPLRLARLTSCFDCATVHSLVNKNSATELILCPKNIEAEGQEPKACYRLSVTPLAAIWSGAT